MKYSYKNTLLAALAALALTTPAQAAQLGTSALAKATAALRATVPAWLQTAPVKVTAATVDTKSKTLTFTLSAGYNDVPVTAESIGQLKAVLRKSAGAQYAKYATAVTVAGTPVEALVANYDKQHARRHATIVSPVSPSMHYKHGLDGNIIALWQSHGWYFEQKLNRWEWQRARIFETVEDLYTQSYVMPFLMPMLQNAGAYVLSPRERDTHDFEVIVDADGALAQTGYSERDGKCKWTTGNGAAFAHRHAVYTDMQNPFTEGTYRQVSTQKKPDGAATASWSADMPKAGEYAIYISYVSNERSVSDATYTVHYLDGEATFHVNQQMGGGTWIYLGHFPLAAGHNKDVVTLTNQSRHSGIVTADAVKIGGGMGNVARQVQDTASPNMPSNADAAIPAGAAQASESDNAIHYTPQLPDKPRYCLGARYWLQWAGAPDSVYTPSHGANDYTDDYKSRALWVNWLAGGSKALPTREGLRLPVDLAFAFHSDAGTTPADSIIGSLGIYMTNDKGNYADGTPRLYSRALTDAILTNIVHDIRAAFEPHWTRRGMWDKSYFEARVPEVPTMLLELLSHQNFADMRYGLDPAFRFTVSRAIYKGMLEFIASRDHRPYTVQPLPVQSFAITAAPEAGTFIMQWQPTADTLTAGADPTHYIILERTQGGAFREVATTTRTTHQLTITDHLLHSYQVIAVNDGGRSFPSETLSLGCPAGSKGTVMVVNGFTRVSAPFSFECATGTKDAIGGFLDAKDHGVPYLYDISYIGAQHEFRRNVPWMDDDASGFGDSHSDYESKVIAGNTFDYPATHGQAIMAAGYSFVSASRAAIEQGLSLDGYRVLDLILGKQRATKIGRGAVPPRYQAFTPELIHAVTAYTAGGGNVLATGAFIATDIFDGLITDKAAQAFAKDVLGYQWRESQADKRGVLRMVNSPYDALTSAGQYTYSNTLNDSVYCVEAPDGIMPAGKDAHTILRYNDNNIPAGIAASKAGYRTIVAGVPFETVAGAESRAALMAQFLQALTGK